MKYISIILFFFTVTQLFSKEVTKPENQPEKFKRFTIDFGLGVGYANAVDPMFYNDEFVFGTTFGTNLSYQFNRNFKAGASLSLWYESGQMYHNPQPPSENPNNYRQTILATGTYYPFQVKWFYIICRIGGGNFFFTPDEPLLLSDGSHSASSVIDTGIACNLGLGYEIKTGKKTFIVPSFNFFYTSLGDLDAFPGKIENANPSIYFEFRLSFMLQAFL
jgi:hypothetical protein